MFRTDAKTESIVRHLNQTAVLLSVLIFAIQVVSAANDVAKEPELKDTGKCFLWKVTSPTSTVYLMGGVDYTKDAKDELQVNEAVLQAFDDSDVVMFDTDPFGEKGHLSGELDREKTIAMKLKPKTIQFLMVPDRKVYLELPAPPWYIAGMITFSEFHKIDYSATGGMVSYFSRRLKDTDKRLVEVESDKMKCLRLNDLTAEDQDLFLRKALMDAEDFKVQVDRMLQALEWGDADYVQYVFLKALKKDPALKSIYNNYYFPMSDKITEKLTHYLKGRQNVFAVFDPVFMVGDRGIVEQLKRNPDLKVEQVERQGIKE